MEKKVSTVIFDFGNVLIDLDIPGFYQKVSELTGIRSAEDKQIFEETMSLYERGLINTDLFINRVIHLSKTSVQAWDVIQCWNSMLVGIKPETLDFLKDLKTKYKTYILSNTNPLHIEWVHNHLKRVHGVEEFEVKYLHRAFYSHQLKLAKPQPEIYKVVQSLIGVLPEEILFVDDLEKNVYGARDVGWIATRHIPGNPLKETLKSFISI